MRKRKRIIEKLKTSYWKKTHKYGIEVPKDWADATRIDELNKDKLWQTAIHDEMKEIIDSLVEHEAPIEDLIGFVKIMGHLIFDVKLGEKFRRKARYVADGHKIESPRAMTYSTVVGRDSVRIMLLVVALNELSVKAADIKNAFLTGPHWEKHYIIVGPEFGIDQGK